MAKRSHVTDQGAAEPPKGSSFVRITSKGEVTIIGRPRREHRFAYGGIVFIQAAGGRMVRADARDLSLHGIGIRINDKLKAYKIGARLEIEFAYPHELSGLLIEVELRRVLTYGNGANDCGFQIVSHNILLNKRLRALITSFEKADPWLAGT